MPHPIQWFLLSVFVLPTLCLVIVHCSILLVINCFTTMCHSRHDISRLILIPPHTHLSTHPNPTTHRSPWTPLTSLFWYLISLFCWWSNLCPHALPLNVDVHLTKTISYRSTTISCMSTTISESLRLCIVFFWPHLKLMLLQEQGLCWKIINKIIITWEFIEHLTPHNVQIYNSVNKIKIVKVRKKLIYCHWRSGFHTTLSTTLQVLRACLCT